MCILQVAFQGVESPQLIIWILGQKMFSVRKVVWNYQHPKLKLSKWSVPPTDEITEWGGLMCTGMDLTHL